MQVHHLVHSERRRMCDAIRCQGCGQQFEIPYRALTNPERLLAWKESIAAKHSCRTPRPISRIRVLQFPTGAALESYWTGEMRRLMPAQA